MQCTKGRLFGANLATPSPIPQVSFALAQPLMSVSVTCLAGRVVLFIGGNTNSKGGCTSSVAALDLTALPPAGSVLPLVANLSAAVSVSAVSGDSVAVFNGREVDIFSLPARPLLTGRAADDLPRAPGVPVAVSPLAAAVFAADTSTLSRFHVLANATATWAPQHPDTLLAHLPPQPLAKPGDAASVSFAWRSDGSDVCGASTWGGDGCVANGCAGANAYKSVHCVGGTGDFRVGLFDSAAGGLVNSSGFCPFTTYSGMEKCLGEKPFIEYRGYHLRLFPHAGLDAKAYPTAVPCGWYKMAPVSKPTFLFGDARVAEFGCFDVQAGGAPSKLTLSYLRKSASEVELTAELNGVIRKATDSDAKLQPLKVDTWAIQFPNDRPYKYVDWS